MPSSQWPQSAFQWRCNDNQSAGNPTANTSKKTGFKNSILKDVKEQEADEDGSLTTKTFDSNGTGGIGFAWAGLATDPNAGGLANTGFEAITLASSAAAVILAGAELTLLGKRRRRN